MHFKRSSPRFSHSPLMQTPYQKAGQAWDERIGNARVQARNWRLMAFGLLSLLFAMTAALIWQNSRSTITPYVVEVDRLGEVRAVGPASQEYRPADAHVAYQLERFTRNVRSLPIDPIVLRQNWLEAYDYVTERGAATLNEYARINNPFARVGKTSVVIDIRSVVRASENSFQVRWTERHFTNGAATGVEHWTAIFSLMLRPPKDEQQLKKNPLGLYVDGLDWTREVGINE